MKKIIIVGAGIGGLTTAAELAKSGLDVTVLEAHVDPGGCAATFSHQGFHFDAGATLAGGFAPGAPLDVLGQRFGIDWQSHPVEVAMQVHLPDGSTVTRWSDAQRWKEERQHHFGQNAEVFWNWQERTADRLWQFARQFSPWPPQNVSEIIALGTISFNWLRQQSIRDSVQIARAAFEPVIKYITPHNKQLRQFIDAQLLISAQTTSQSANALYSAAALDLSRQGVVHLPGGMGSIAENLAQAISGYGGQVRYRQTVTHVRPLNKRQFEIETQHGETLRADAVIFNLPPWNIKSLLGNINIPRFQQLADQPIDGWGAFVVYAGIKADIIPPDLPLHQQIIVREPLGEGNSIFLSLNPAWDTQRAPEGYRTVTISTHTRLAPWWQLQEQDPPAYEVHKTRYAEQIIAASARVLPGFSRGSKLVMPGTPVTFQRFTRRAWGWVGGFPQTNLFRAWAPRLAPGLWMVGDSIFPGQSVPAVALGGLRVAQGVLADVSGAHSFHKLPIRNLTRAEDFS